MLNINVLASDMNFKALNHSGEHFQLSGKTSIRKGRKHPKRKILVEIRSPHLGFIDLWRNIAIIE